MFDFYDKRTPAERERDLRFAETRQQNGLLATGFLNVLRRAFSQDETLQVGLVGQGHYGDGAELLIESDGVTYKLTCRVDHE